jgi:hypothetical protein
MVRGQAKGKMPSHVPEAKAIGLRLRRLKAAEGRSYRTMQFKRCFSARFSQMALTFGVAGLRRASRASRGNIVIP